MRYTFDLFLATICHLDLCFVYFRAAFLYRFYCIVRKETLEKTDSEILLVLPLCKCAHAFSLRGSSFFSKKYAISSYGYVLFNLAYLNIYMGTIIILKRITSELTKSSHKFMMGIPSTYPRVWYLIVVFTWIPTYLMLLP